MVFVIHSFICVDVQKTRDCSGSWYTDRSTTGLYCSSARMLSTRLETLRDSVSASVLCCRSRSSREMRRLMFGFAAIIRSSVSRSICVMGVKIWDVLI